MYPVQKICSKDYACRYHEKFEYGEIHDAEIPYGCHQLVYEWNHEFVVLLCFCILMAG